MRPCRAKSTQRLRHFVAGTACRSAPMRKRYTTRWDPVSCKLLIGNLSDSFFVFYSFLVFRFSHKDPSADGGDRPCLSGPGQAVHIGPHYDVGGSCSHPLVAQSRGPRADCNGLFEFISNQTSLPPLACLACHPTPCNGCSRGAQTLKSRPGRERRGLGPRPTAGRPLKRRPPGPPRQGPPRPVFPRPPSLPPSPPSSRPRPPWPPPQPPAEAATCSTRSAWSGDYPWQGSTPASRQSHPGNTAPASSSSARSA
mmetsp:Transcript_5843/g.22266  ORF Transcript_5843/g.22266 Transcript_5843/m.22266 type:complete len:254 (-) Transcript_5843:284-1045(-)